MSRPAIRAPGAELARRRRAALAGGAGWAWTPGVAVKRGRRRDRRSGSRPTPAAIFARRPAAGRHLRRTLQQAVERQRRAARHGSSVHQPTLATRRRGQRHRVLASSTSSAPAPTSTASRPPASTPRRRRSSAERPADRGHRAPRSAWRPRRSTAGARCRCTGRSATARRGAGDAVSHAFGAAGAFNVTVTATDAAGNATSATRPIAVAGRRRCRGSTPPCSSRWGFDRRKRFIFLLRLRVKAPPKGAVAELRCKRPQVPVQAQARHADPQEPRSTSSRRSIQAAAAASGPGQTAAAAHHGARPHRQGRQVPAPPGRIPSGRTFCLPPGASEAAARRC